MARKKVFHPSEEWGRTAIFSRAGRSGRAVFYIRYSFKGRRYAEKAGGNFHAAERLLGLRHAAIRDNPNAFLPKTEQNRQKRAKDGPPFRAFYEGRFTRDYAAGRRSDYYTYIGRDLCDWFGDKPLGTITSANVDRFRHAQPIDFPAPPDDHEGRDPRTRRAPSPSTIRRRLAVLQLVFEVAKRWGLVNGNPVIGVDRPKEPKNRKTNFLTRIEFDSILEASPPWLQPMLSLAVNTGLRRKEIVNLRWEDIDFENRQVYVSQDNKTGRGRYVPMNVTVVALLRKQRDRVRAVQRETDPTRIVPWVFVDGEGNEHCSEQRRATVSRAYESAAKAIGLGRETTFHDLRHTAASWMVQAGVPLYEVQHVLGHRDSQTTQRYAHLTPERLRQAVEVLDAIRS